MPAAWAHVAAAINIKARIARLSIDFPTKKPPEKGAEERDSEPILGSGAAPALAYAVSWIVTFFVIGWLTRH